MPRDTFPMSSRASSCVNEAYERYAFQRRVLLSSRRLLVVALVTRSKGTFAFLSGMSRRLCQANRRNVSFHLNGNILLNVKICNGRTEKISKILFDVSQVTYPSIKS